MDKVHVIQTLRNHRDELRVAGVVHLSVFGSVARGDASQQSDVDLMADFDKSERLTLVKTGNLQYRLSELLGAEVELPSAEWMREPVRSRAMRESVLAFLGITQLTFATLSRILRTGNRDTSYRLAPLDGEDWPWILPRSFVLPEG
jgi:uncharacterized protein